MKTAAGVFVLAVSALAQTPQPASALISNADVSKLCGRLTELMTAVGPAVPALDRAAAPVIEMNRATCVQLQIYPARAEPTYNLLSNLRAFLGLADAIPKPYPFSDAAQRQLIELREDSTRLDAHFRALLDTADRRLMMPDPANLLRYSEANRRLAAPDASNPRVVFFGDSITDYWPLHEYFPDRDYINRGISGQTTGELLQRFRADVAELHPQAVLILAGVNDLYRHVPLSDIESNYQVLADLAAISKIKVIFASVLPVSDYHKDENPALENTRFRPPASILALNQWLKTFCAQRGCGYVDYFSGVVDERGQLQADLSEDGLHPNSKGYRLMGPQAAAAIEEALSRAPEPQKPQGRPQPSNMK